MALDFLEKIYYENDKFVENLEIDKLPWLVLFNKGEKYEPTFTEHKYSWKIKSDWQNLFNSKRDII